jgi:hypothetical protein
MGRASFVAWLFIMAIACFVMAAADASWGWLIGGIVFLSVALFASRQFKKEQEVGPETASLSFVGIAILVMILAMCFLVWLQESV